MMFGRVNSGEGDPAVQSVGRGLTPPRGQAWGEEFEDLRPDLERYDEHVARHVGDPAACGECEKREATIEELQRGLRHAQSKAILAVRQASKLKVELDARCKEDLEFKERVQAVQEREGALEEANMRVRDEVKQLKYRCKCLSSELEDKTQELRDTKLRSNARLDTLSKTIQRTEREAHARRQGFRAAAHAIQDTVLDLQRHFGSRGFHAINSHTAQRLMEKLMDASEGITEAAMLHSPRKKRRRRRHVRSAAHSGAFSDSDSDDESRRGEGSIGGSTGLDWDGDLHRKIQRSAILVDVKDHHRSEEEQEGGAFQLTAAQSPLLRRKRDTLVRDLSKVCLELESDNSRLQRAVRDLKLELESIRRTSGDSALVPKYRLAIVQARSKAKACQDRLERVTEQLRETTLTLQERSQLLDDAREQRDKLDKLARASREENNDLRQRIRDLEAAERKRRHALDEIQREKEIFHSARAAQNLPVPDAMAGANDLASAHLPLTPSSRATGTGTSSWPTEFDAVFHTRPATGSTTYSASAASPPGSLTKARGALLEEDSLAGAERSDLAQDLHADLQKLQQEIASLSLTFA
ncbi:Hypothetical protein SCF082_LOCUS29798 [Durusdinium trenchii]|uniref:Uncharacterized protein n=1 Tax=Durusdinium trenchii TaxID=1381693 RepID=A0ABP0MV62_9DINO